MKLLAMIGALLIAGCSLDPPPSLSVEEQVRQIKVCTDNGLGFERMANVYGRIVEIHCIAAEKTP